MNKRVYLSSPHMGGSELKYVQEAFDENDITPRGAQVVAFEKEIATLTNTGYAAALNSGTAAIHLALILSGVTCGDEVLVSTFTFSASVNPIIYQGATPIFVDSEPDTWNICPESLKKAIEDRISKGKKPKALVLVYLYGQPAKIQEIKAITDQYDIVLIEDAAEAIGAYYQGKHVGSFGQFGVFSFNANKMITASGGGMLVSQNEELIQKAKFLAAQARDPVPYYQHSEIGYNYMMSNIVAAVGRAQLEVLDQWVEKRKAHFEAYKKAFSSISPIRFCDEYQGTQANRWLSCLLIDSTTVTPEMIREALEAQNIESRKLWKPMHLQPVFEKYPYYGDRLSEQLFEIGLCLPSSSNMSVEDRDRTIDVIKRFF